jgi:hypothetical protein
MAINIQPGKRTIFFGPDWGVVIVDVDESGKIVSVKSTWGEGSQELKRILSWKKVRYVVRPLPGEVPKVASPEFSVPKTLPNAPAVPPGYAKLLIGFYRITREEHPSEEWMSLDYVYETLADSDGALIAELSAEGGIGGFIASYNGRIAGAFFRSPESVFYNEQAAKAMRDANLLFPMRVRICLPPEPQAGYLSFLPLWSERPSLSGNASTLAKLLSSQDAFGVLFAGKAGYILDRGSFWDMASGSRIGKAQILSHLALEAEVFFYEGKIK